MHKTQKAFTMLELIFVIAVIGILSAVAIPKFAASRSDAVIATAKNTVASIRTAISTERQKNILRGDFGAVTSLGTVTGYDAIIFDSVLDYPLQSCKDASAQECWHTADNITYKFKMPVSGEVDFNITSNLFNCKVPTSDNCKKLTQ